MPVEDEMARDIQQISYDPLQAKPFEIGSDQSFGMEISQQVMGQVRQEDVTLLTKEAAFTASFQAQTGFVIPKLFDFSTTSSVITGHQKPFRRQTDGSEVVTVPVNTMVKPAFDEHADRTTIVCWWFHFAEPNILIGIPTFDLSGQSFRSAIGHPFGNDLVASFQKPTNVPVATCTAIQTPNRALALAWG